MHHERALYGVQTRILQLAEKLASLFLSKLYGLLEGVGQGFFQLLRVLSSFFSSQFVNFTFGLKLARNNLLRILKNLMKNCLCQNFCDFSGQRELQYLWLGWGSS